jgi:putative oxidoreductase
MLSNNNQAPWISALARIAMGISFLYFGISKLWAITGTIGFVGSKLPLAPFVFWLAVVLEAGLGLLLVIGYETRRIGAFLAFYCVFTAVVFHTNFANRLQMDHFFSNIVMAAGFLYLFANGPGRWALENRRGDA